MKQQMPDMNPKFSNQAGQQDNEELQLPKQGMANGREFDNQEEPTNDDETDSFGDVSDIEKSIYMSYSKILNFPMSISH